MLKITGPQRVFLLITVLRTGERVTIMNRPRETLLESNPDLWTLTQAADFLDVSRKQLLDLIRQVDLRYIQRGLRIRIHRGELERYHERTAH